MSSSPSANGAGYLSGLAAYSPWPSRAATPKPQQLDGSGKGTEAPYEAQRGGDHTINRRHRLSLRKYPRDCPPLNVQWYHATDVPKRKPLQTADATKAPIVPKKYVPFSDRDSRAIEQAFQKLAEQGDTGAEARLAEKGGINDVTGDVGISADDSQGTKLRRTADEPDDSTKVPVNEDFLFDVDIERRELAPTYWLGPVYDCRRGTWFTVEGSVQKPCDENLATQLEEGYLKLKPWTFSKAGAVHERSTSQSSQIRSRPTSVRLTESPVKPKSRTGSGPITPKGSSDELRKASGSDSATTVDSSLPADAIQRTFRLFGAHMNSVVTFQDETTAWIMTDDFLSGMRGTMYERFGGGAHYAGIKVVRGFAETAKKDVKDSTKSSEASPKVGPTIDRGQEEKSQDRVPDDPPSPSLTRRVTLERQMSKLVETGAFNSRENEEEELRKRDEKEIENDYNEADDDEQGREIEHLILVTHGIGQQLGLRFESVNFVHDVNTLRKTLKAVYGGSDDLQALNTENDKPMKNCRIQVLPICWRHLLDFPKQSLKHNRKEHDLGDLNEEEEETYPSVDDITVNNVFRSLITDLALDILLYQSPAYKGHITRIVLEECNRIYGLFKKRNPNFKGKVSLMGHSLGSAILFDILCHQKADYQPVKRQSVSRHTQHKDEKLQLAFEVEDFYALGSPIGLFTMLKGRTIAARRDPKVKPAQTPFSFNDDDPFSTPSYSDSTTSAPKCERLYNIFHPTDPISYRLEPLITPAMSKLKPQPLPYTKKTLFGASGQGIAGIGSRVGQSVSGLWSGLTSGIASSLLNRSLGISADDAARIQQSRTPSSAGAGTNITAGGVVSSGPLAPGDAERLLKGELTIRDGEDGVHPPTLLDSEIETLYDGFQRKRTDNPLEKGEERRELEEQARKLKKEEGKVRALNANGRVDYSIQEGTFDLSLLAGIASHLSYWAEEDVSHFIISQLLSRHRVLSATTGQKRKSVLQVSK